MKSEKVIFNPKRSEIDFKFYEKLAQTSQATEKGGSERYDYQYSEEDPFPVTVKTAKHNFKLYTYREESKIPAIGILVFLHAKQFAEKGLICIGFDFRGFGQSSKNGNIKHGMLTNYMDLVEDLKSVLYEIDSRYSKELPRFLFGESMGGMVGIIHGIENPAYFKGMLFFSPAIIDNNNNAYFGKKICWWLDSLFLGNLTIKSSPKPLATKNIDIFEKSLKNSLIVSDFVIPHSVIQMQEGMKYTHKNLYKFQTDFCCVQAGIDKLVDIKGAFDLVENSKSKDKTLIFLPTAWHCISVETELLDIIDYLTKWVLKKCQS